MSDWLPSLLRKGRPGYPRRERLAAESSEEREARLQSRRERLAAESSEEREARLQTRRERLAAESSEERDSGQATVAA